MSAPYRIGPLAFIMSGQKNPTEGTTLTFKGVLQGGIEAFGKCSHCLGSVGFQAFGLVKLKAGSLVMKVYHVPEYTTFRLPVSARVYVYLYIYTYICVCPCAYVYRYTDVYVDVEGDVNV